MVTVEQVLESVHTEADKAWMNKNFALGETQERIFKTGFMSGFMSGYSRGHKTGFYTGLAVGAVFGVAIAALGFTVSK